MSGAITDTWLTSISGYVKVFFLFPHLLLVVQIQSAMHVSSEKLVDDLTIKQPEGLPLTPQLPARALVQINWRQDVPVEFPPPRVFPPLNDTVTATYG
jgi:hypothetical protein